jgi:hypothetical protein
MQDEAPFRRQFFNLLHGSQCIYTVDHVLVVYSFLVQAKQGHPPAYMQCVATVFCGERPNPLQVPGTGKDRFLSGGHTRHCAYITAA